MSKQSNEKRKKKRSRKRNKAHASLKSLSAMKSKKGVRPRADCNVCGQNRILTFDHVPPKKTRKIIQKHSHWLKDKDILVENQDGDTVVQKLGFETVCKECNGIGSGYVDEYNEMIVQLLNHINQGWDNRFVEITINPLIVFKQILYMFLVQNDEFKWYKYHPYLLYRLFESRQLTYSNLESLLKIYMGFHTGPDLSYHPDQVAKGNLAPDAPITLSKEYPSYTAEVDISELRIALNEGVFDNGILFPPFFYRLIITHDLTQNINVGRLTDITSFSACSDQARKIELPIIKNDIGTPPSSFRSSLVKWKEVPHTPVIANID